MTFDSSSFYSLTSYIHPFSNVITIQTPARNPHESLIRRQVHRRLNQLQLGLVVRDEYAVDAKSKFIAGNFQLGRGNVIGTSSQPRLELRKTVQLMKSWITEIYSILDQEWPFLNFKMCVDGNTRGRESVDTLPEDVAYSYDSLGSTFISRKGSRKGSQMAGASRKGSTLASPLSNPFSPAGDSSLSPMPSPFKVRQQANYFLIHPLLHALTLARTSLLTPLFSISWHHLAQNRYPPTAICPLRFAIATVSCSHRPLSAPPSTRIKNTTITLWTFPRCEPIKSSCNSKPTPKYCPR